MIQKENSHINTPFSIENLDRYYIRTTIFKSLKNNLPFFKGKLLDVGCGKMPYKDFILTNSLVNEYIGIDIETEIEYDKDIKPDRIWDGERIPYDINTFDTVLATEVLEHCPIPSSILDEIYRVLKPGGYFFITVPFLWPLHEVPHDEYRYTPFALKRLFEEAGFIDIVIKATGGWNSSLAQMLGLWVRRSGLSYRKRKYFSKLIKPVIRSLIKNDIPPTEFSEGVMIPNLYALARKTSLP